jgi:alpha-methylacyl-CoA racemase
VLVPAPRQAKSQNHPAVLAGLGLAEELDGVGQNERATWPELRERFAARIRERNRADWEAVFAGTDACVSPVLAPDEVLADDHLAARRTYLDGDGLVQPAPAPRFETTPLTFPAPAPMLGADTVALLEELGLALDEIQRLVDEDAVDIAAAPPARTTLKESS